MTSQRERERERESSFSDQQSDQLADEKRRNKRKKCSTAFFLCWPILKCSHLTWQTLKSVNFPFNNVANAPPANWITTPVTSKTAAKDSSKWTKCQLDDVRPRSTSRSTQRKWETDALAAAVHWSPFKLIPLLLLDTVTGSFILLMLTLTAEATYRVPHRKAVKTELS